MPPSRSPVPFKPYSVLNIDCLDMMAAIRDNAVDMVFADPLFNLGKKYRSYQGKLPLEEYLQWTDQWPSEALRILKPTGGIFVYNIPRLFVHTVTLLSQRVCFKKGK